MLKSKGWGLNPIKSQERSDQLLELHDFPPPPCAMLKNFHNPETQIKVIGRLLSFTWVSKV